MDSQRKKLCKVCEDEIASLLKGIRGHVDLPLVGATITADVIFLDKPVPTTECEFWSHKLLRKALTPHPVPPFNLSVIHDYKRWTNEAIRAPSGEFES